METQANALCPASHGILFILSILFLPSEQKVLIYKNEGEGDLSATYIPKPKKKRGWRDEWVFSIYNV
jgi:hypothetical protein